MSDRLPLGKKEFDFCVAIFEGQANVEAYRNIYHPSPDISDAQIIRDAKKLLKQKEIRQCINEFRAKVIRCAILKQEDLLAYWTAIATCDPTDLVSVTRRCCRYCYGIDFKYQFINEDEHAEKIAKNFDSANPVSIDSGGFGFNALRSPNTNCPRCFGIGIESVQLKDIDNLPFHKKILFDGFKKTNQGYELKFLARLEALKMLTTMSGMLKDKIQSPSLQVNANIPFDSLREMTQDPNHAAKVYRDIMWRDE